ncbi:hypothetical protein [Streptomyces sp. NPDC051162]|uniref:hypothetical protein n=1 Tax=Streptomyces sp. NPDC051162 TaxID=3154747 RepID=UPI00341E400C
MTPETLAEQAENLIWTLCGLGFTAAAAGILLAITGTTYNRTEMTATGRNLTAYGLPLGLVLAAFVPVSHWLS